MDPNTNIAELLDLAHQILDRADNERLDEDHAERLAELMVALDGWIRGGGFLPRVWKQT